MLQQRAGAASYADSTLARAVADYRPDQFLFASPNSTLLTTGPLQWLAPGAAPLGVRAGQALAGAAASARADEVDAASGYRSRPQLTAAPVLVGAVPFDASQAAQLAVTIDYLRGGPMHAGLAGMTGPRQVPLHVQTTPWPAPQDFEAAVELALSQLKAGPLSKVVLARTLRLHFDADLNVAALLLTLLRKHPQAYTYAVPAMAQTWISQSAGAQAAAPAAGSAVPDAYAAVFLGATPELLVRRVGRRVCLNPLAGSAARRPDLAEDAAVAQALMHSDKDLREHAVVIKAIEKVLRPLCHTLRVPAAPSLVATDTLWHLSTEIEGELADPVLTSLDLAMALHPTPAVCGHPLAAARTAIAELEPFDRALFAGFVGWMDTNGDGEWAVALRCAACAPRAATLYAGAGIVSGSDPSLERQETQTKFRTMLSAMGFDEAIAAS